MVDVPIADWAIGEQLASLVRDVFEVEDITVTREPARGIRLRGHLLTSSDYAYDVMWRRFRDMGYTPLLRQDGASHVVMAVPGRMPRQIATKPWVPALLLVLTITSVMYIGAAMNADPLRGLRLADGIPFAASLIAILGCHELGHYFAARRVGTPVTLPYFIPMPIPPFGTMGAFIQMKGPTRSRRDLLKIAVAGPLSGLAVAIPVLIWGLAHSNVEPLPPGGYILEGNSLLYAALKILIFGRFLPSGGVDVMLHPVAFAGWAGLLVTGLNLIPAGQLDGGHIAYALLGRRAQYLTMAIIGILVALGFVWNGWWLWAFLIYLFSRTQASPLDEVTELTPPQRWLAIGMAILFVLVFVPVPLTVH